MDLEAPASPPIQATGRLKIADLNMTVRTFTADAIHLLEPISTI